MNPELSAAIKRLAYRVVLANQKREEEETEEGKEAA